MKTIEAIENIDLTREINNLLCYYNLSQQQKDIILQHDFFKNSIGKDPIQQKALLTMLFYRLIVHNVDYVPKNIRLCLVAHGTPIEWLDNVKLNIIPYIIHINLLEKLLTQGLSDV